MSDLFCLPHFVTGVGNSLSRDCQSAYCVIPQRSYRNPRENAYTIGFSPMPLFNNPRSIRKDCGYNTNQPKSRSSMQTFSRSGTLPSYFPQQAHETGTGQSTVQQEVPKIVTVATESEVATIF